MEKKRVAGRFVRENEDGPVVKRAVGAPRPKYCRTFTRKRVAEVLPEIVERFSEEAKKGSIQHAKVLMKLGGLDQRDAPPKPRKQRGKSLIGLLMEDLERGPTGGLGKEPAGGQAEEGSPSGETAAEA
jgi:hypothetical protein